MNNRTTTRFQTDNHQILSLARVRGYEITPDPVETKRLGHVSFFIVTLTENDATLMYRAFDKYDRKI